MARKTTPAVDDVQEIPKLTRAEVAKMVTREVPVVDEKTKKPTGKTKPVALREDEIYDWAEYDDRVVVCTVDGQKLMAKK